ncbi:MAG: hypothetical protein Q8850_02870, partial [Candidatus Phytoplasma australasiaticum]|nr:hypothetical protein [Candidatus Phytoplasma australasiaticum]
APRMVSLAVNLFTVRKASRESYSALMGFTKIDITSLSNSELGETRCVEKLIQRLSIWKIIGHLIIFVQGDIII